MDTEGIILEVEGEEEAERQRQLRRRQRIEEMKLQKKKTERMHRCVMTAAVVVLLFAGIGVGVAVRAGIAASATESGNAGSSSKDGNAMAQAAQPQDGLGAIGSSEIVGTLGETGASESVDTPEMTGASIAAGASAVTGTFTEAGPSAAVGSEGMEADNFANPETPEAQSRPAEPAFSPRRTDATAGFGESVVSEYGVLIDIETGEILAARDANARINPASMTKILTVLTAADALGIDSNDAAVLDDTFVMTIEITDYSYVNDCTIAGFQVGEENTVRDLFYGTILPSGADAAVGLAVYAAGSQEAFMELMNQKLEKLGLNESTHFENCVGLYDTNHYSTVSDMAVILKEAADNEFCREVLSAHTYNTSVTEQHPEGILLSNWFLRRIEDKDTHGEVLCGKTGFVDQSGSCAASLATDYDGREYLCVTAGSTSSWRCIYDQVDIFQRFL